MGSDESRTILNLYLDLALLKNKKTAYQDFFVQVAISLWGADFEPRKPQGSLGDKKCDGYRVSEKAVFQVYAPEKFDAKDGNKKILEDFEGAKKHFGQEMKKWIPKTSKKLSLRRLLLPYLILLLSTKKRA